jgi:signal transduction histidine kinase
VSLDPDDLIRSLSEDLPLGVWVARAPGGEFLYANAEFNRIMGMGPVPKATAGGYSEPYGVFDSDGRLYPDERLPFSRALRERKLVMADDLVVHRGDGGHVPVRAFARPIFDASGHITHVVVAFFDISMEVQARKARAESEARLHRAQRMESVGKLAGGIAHDFNNLLTAIRSIASRLSESEGDPERLVDLRTIDEVAERASALTRALTSFGGRTRSFSQSVSLHAMLESLSEVLGRALDPSICVELDLDAQHDKVAGDLSQLEQVVMNLALNARDAMPEGGRLIMRTRDVELHDDAVLAPGQYVVMELADTGVGIDPAVRDHMFEPYVSSKENGGGLGLATVYGIVEEHHGSIEALDHPPRGTLVRVTLPIAEGLQPVPQPPPSRGKLATGNGTVLLVEDEQLVRVATFRALKQLGYHVIACADGDEAVEIFRDRQKDIHGVLLDVAMPKMGGRQTYQALREIDPQVRVLLMAGNGSDEVDLILSLGALEFLPKPFELRALSQALERVLR